MMPAKKILAMKQVPPLPPLLVIDESSIKNFKDVSPYCECFERYQAIQNYISFLPGGVNPYKRRKLPDECLKVIWVPQTMDYKKAFNFEGPVAISIPDLPKNYISKESSLEDFTLVRLPKKQLANPF